MWISHIDIHSSHPFSEITSYLDPKPPKPPGPQWLTFFPPSSGHPPNNKNKKTFQTMNPNQKLNKHQKQTTETTSLKDLKHLFSTPNSRSEKQKRNNPPPQKKKTTQLPPSIGLVSIPLTLLPLECWHQTSSHRWIDSWKCGPKRGQSTTFERFKWKKSSQFSGRQKVGWRTFLKFGMTLTRKQFIYIFFCRERTYPPLKVDGKNMFLFHRWDMLVRRVYWLKYLPTSGWTWCVTILWLDWLYNLSWKSKEVSSLSLVVCGGGGGGSSSSRSSSNSSSSSSSSGGEGSRSSRSSRRRSRSRRSSNSSRSMVFMHASVSQQKRKHIHRTLLENVVLLPSKTSTYQRSGWNPKKQKTMGKYPQRILRNPVSSSEKEGQCNSFLGFTWVFVSSCFAFDWWVPIDIINTSLVVEGRNCFC